MPLAATEILGIPIGIFNTNTTNSPPHQGIPQLSSNATAAFKMIAGAPEDANLTAESGPVNNFSNLVDLNADARHHHCGGAMGQAENTTDELTTAPTLSASSLNDTDIYDASTSYNNDVDLITMNSSGED